MNYNHNSTSSFQLIRRAKSGDESLNPVPTAILKYVEPIKSYEVSKFKFDLLRSPLLVTKWREIQNSIQHNFNFDWFNLFQIFFQFWNCHVMVFLMYYGENLEANWINSEKVILSWPILDTYQLGVVN